MWYVQKKGILLSNKKEQIWVYYSKVDETRACYTVGSKSEKEKQIQENKTYKCKL